MSLPVFVLRWLTYLWNKQDPFTFSSSLFSSLESVNIRHLVLSLATDSFLSSSQDSQWKHLGQDVEGGAGDRLFRCPGLKETLGIT